MKNVGIFLLVLISLFACSNEKRQPEVRSVYYWSTTLNIDSMKTTFIRNHDITKMYLRYFDVVDNAGLPMPNATLRFATPVPDGMEIVPTVFIVNDCMKHDVAGLADKILRRILQMNETNDVGGVKEMQIDCDWTLSTRRRFYAFLTEMREKAHEKGLRLSVTVRLHQLSQSPPPADRGVLMMYNTGDFTKLSCNKPILDIHDAAPFLRYLSDYELPLAAAFPIYSWRILFRGGHYVGIMHTDDELPMMAGDTIVTRQPSLDDIMEARKALNSRRDDTKGETILFDLSNQNIQRFNPNDYEKILGH